MQATQPDPVADEVLESVFVRLALGRPLLVEEIAAGATYNVEMTINQNCRWTQVPVREVRIFDKGGLVSTQLLPIPTDQATVHWNFSFEGQAPWLVVAEPYACDLAAQTNGTWLGKGRALEEEALFYDRFPERYDNVTMVLEAGQLRARAFWEPGPGDWNAIFSKPVMLSGRGTYVGKIEGFYPGGEIMRTDTYGLTARHTASFEPVQLFHGQYELVMNATRPPLERTEVQYQFHLLSMGPAMCDLGFEWPWLCPQSGALKP